MWYNFTVRSQLLRFSSARVNYYFLINITILKTIYFEAMSLYPVFKFCILLFAYFM